MRGGGGVRDVRQKITWIEKRGRLRETEEKRMSERASERCERGQQKSVTRQKKECLYWREAQRARVKGRKMGFTRSESERDSEQARTRKRERK